MQSNLKEFWEYSFKNNDQSIPSNLKTINRNLLNTPRSIVNGFAISVCITASTNVSSSTNQHSSISKRPTTTNLVEFSEFLANNIDNNKQMDVVYPDLAKAFDSVDYTLFQRKDFVNYMGPLVLPLLTYLKRSSRNKLRPVILFNTY